MPKRTDFVCGTHTTPQGSGCRDNWSYLYTPAHGGLNAVVRWRLSNVGYRLLTGDEEHVPRPAPRLRAAYVLHLRAVAVLVAVLVGALRLLVLEVKSRKP